MISVTIAGAGGRMGQMLVAALERDPGLQLVGALGRHGSHALGQDARVDRDDNNSVVITDDLARGLAGAQVLIDFTHPSALRAHLEACVAQQVAMVIGTTGLSTEERALVNSAAAHIPIVYSPNMSVGVNVVFKLLEVAAETLDEAFDVEIIETHHRGKRDAPSGTALRMGEVIEQAWQSTGTHRPLAASSAPGHERQPGSIGFASIRAGDVVGEHTVLFAGSGERIEITHRATSRLNFASGSLRAVHFAASAPRGLYDMQDVLQLRGRSPG